MGKLISITSNSKAKDSYATTLKEIFNARGKSVYICKQNWVHKNAESPYVSAIFDVNNRYEQQPTIIKNLKKYDYVIVEGYTAKTIINQFSKLNTKQLKKSFSIWLDSLESATYGIKRPDFSLLCANSSDDTLGELYNLFPNDFILTTKAKISEVVNNFILSNGSSYQKNYNSTIPELLATLNLNKKLSYEITNTPFIKNDSKLLDLISTKKLVSKREPNNYYYQSLVTPLYSSVILNQKPIKSYSDSLIKYSRTINQNYDNIVETELLCQPKNEMSLASDIGWQYGLDASAINYTQKMRLIETWVQTYSLDSFSDFGISCTTKLTYNDILLLHKYLPRIRIVTPISSSVYGYVDTSDAPSSIAEIVDKQFDDATNWCITSSTDKYLLMGHITPCKIYLTTADILKLINQKNIVKGTELADKFFNSINSLMAEKFPIIHSTIND